MVKNILVLVDQVFEDCSKEALEYKENKKQCVKSKVLESVQLTLSNFGELEPRMSKKKGVSLSHERRL